MVASLQHRALFRVCLALFALIILAMSTALSHAGQEYRVGVYRNPPMVTYSSTGEAGGIQVELLEDIARQEGWTLHFVPGTFKECFERLKRHEIDILPGIAYTSDRARFVDFNNETILVNWGQVVVPTGSHIQSILDLNGKKVAVVRESVYYCGPTGIKPVAEQFGINPVFVEVDEYPDVLQMVAEHKVDAGVVQRFSISTDTRGLDVHPSPVLISPVEVRYAFAKAEKDALALTIDRYLHGMKEDTSSPYHRHLSNWIGNSETHHFPRWLKVLVAGGGIITFCLLGAFLAARLQILKSKSDLQKRDELLTFVASHDALTGLPNQNLLREMMDHALAARQRSGTTLALLILDLDRFKNINDTMGHAWGDRVLKELAIRLRSLLRDTDTVARYGGDEFALILENLPDATAAVLVVRKILEEMSHPILLEDREFYFTASIGISIAPDDRSSREELITCAEIAMYEAKDGGGNTYRFYRPEMDAKAHSLLVLETDLRRAIEREQMVIHYQPLYDMISGSMTGMEALVRWKHPEQGLVAPMDFIPLAERTGLIIPLGEWILTEICRQLGDWCKRGITPPRVAVNISAYQFRHPDFLASVDRILEASGTPPSLLEFEITETVTMGDFEEVLSTLSAIRQRGISLAIDDFGTGYSSLTYLKRFPINKLKIDRTFVSEITTDQNDAAIASAIIHLARSMELGVVAEGIETEEQRSLLMDKGCILGQGYYFSHPVSPEELERLLFSKP